MDAIDPSSAPAVVAAELGGFNTRQIIELLRSICVSADVIGVDFLGGAGAESISDGSGENYINGGNGADVINLVADSATDVLDYNCLSDGGDTINGFDAQAPGAGGDVIDLVNLLATGSFTGSTFDQAVDGGYMALENVLTDTIVKVDLDGNGDDFVEVATVTNTTALELDDNIWVAPDIPIA